MSRSSNNSTVSIIAGSLAVTGAVAAASMWSNFRHHADHTDQKDPLIPKFIGEALTPADPEKIRQVINASFDYIYHDLPAHIVGDMQMVRKRTPKDRDEIVRAVNSLISDLTGGNHHVLAKGQKSKGLDQLVEAFFKYFYVAKKNKGDRSVSTENTDDTSVLSSSSSRSVSLEGMGVVEATESSKTAPVNDTTETILSSTEEEQAEKTIDYAWDDEVYVEHEAAAPKPVSGADAAALFLAGAFVAAQAFVC
ncbi:unnamed protein product [Cylindrotheca closterium]|uniref:Uncharacterized protein n=1 Tax=Cylindrotheca closterium TaxID=2856 RepID=A0AAD2G0T4_9STRA|nr:unnamed protein product [Cylindrotheca closterium]